MPVEVPIFRSLDEALRSGRISPAAPASDGDPPLVTGDDLPDDAAAMLARTATGDCVFYHRPSGLCVVHRDGGEAQLPSTCRHFPRLAVRDRRGTFVSLTHFCPTAAESLFRDESPIAIVADPPAFPLKDYEGMTVGADDWPPLLHPRMLMDFDSYGAWERHMVTRCADADATPEAVLATLRRDATLLRAFLPGNGSLADAIGALPPAYVQPPPHSFCADLARGDEVVAAMPDDLKPAVDDAGLEPIFMRWVSPEWGAWSAPLKRYLAAKAFANWTAYQGRSILAIVRGLETALALVRVEAARRCREAQRPLDRELLREAIRGADFALNHLAVGEDLATLWSQAEEGWMRSGGLHQSPT